MATCKLHILVYGNQKKKNCFNESLTFAPCLSMPNDIRGIVYSKDKSKLFN
jgi:hypothetical protein